MHRRFRFSAFAALILVLHFPVDTVRAEEAVSTPPSPAAQATPATLEDLTASVEALQAETATIRRQLERVLHLLETRQAPALAPAPAVETTPTARMETRRAERATPTPTPTPPPVHDGPTHVVARGENLTTIARKYETTVAELLKLNQIEDERKLQIGQKLNLPTPPPQPSPASETP